MESVGQLSDGRPCVVEWALVDSYDCRFWYFSAQGLEDASPDGLASLLRSSGFKWPESVAEGPVHTSAKRIRDAQSRDCWEFQLTLPPLD